MPLIQHGLCAQPADETVTCSWRAEWPRLPASSAVSAAQGDRRFCPALLSVETTFPTQPPPGWKSTWLLTCLGVSSVPRILPKSEFYMPTLLCKDAYSFFPFLSKTIRSPCFGLLKQKLSSYIPSLNEISFPHSHENRPTPDF